MAIKNRVDICKVHKKKLLIIGRGMINCLELGSELGYIPWPADILVHPNDCNSVPDDKLVVLVSGSQENFVQDCPASPVTNTGN